MTAPTCRWDYHNADGTLAGYVLRYDDEGKKTILPYFTPDEQGGFRVGIPAGFVRPLYGLHKLLNAAAEPVFITEGEKCAAALHGLGLVAVCTLGGAQAPQLTDLVPLTQYKGPLYLLADNDAAGEAYAAKVAELVNNPNLHIIRLPNLPEGGDVVDWIQQRYPTWNGFQPLSEILTPDELDAERGLLMGECKKGVPPDPEGGDYRRVAIDEPMPLVSLSSEAQPYPVDALGPYLAPVAVAIQDIVKAPMAICAQSALAAATLAVQGHADVIHPNGQRRPISISDLQRGPRCVRKLEPCRKAVAVLVEHGWLVPLDKETTISGKTRKQAWRVIRSQSPLATNRQGKE